MQVPISASVPTAVRRLTPSQSPPQPQAHSPQARAQRPPQHATPATGIGSRHTETDTLRATQSALIAAASLSSSAVVPSPPRHLATSNAAPAACPLDGSLTLPALRHKNLSRFLHTEMGGSIFLNRLRTGGIFLKHGSRGSPHFRFVCCSPDLTRIEWCDLKGKKNSSAPHTAQSASGQPQTTSFVLADSILAVSLGHSTRLLRDRAATSKDSLPERCFSLCTTTRTLDLECVSEQDRDLWHLTFSFLVDYAQKKRTAELKQQHAQQQQQQQQHGSQPLQTGQAPTVSGPGSTPQLLRHVSHSSSSASDGFPGLAPLRPGAPPSDGPQSHLSLVHALELLCDQSIGQAQARYAQQSTQQQQQQHPQVSDPPPSHPAGLEIPPPPAPSPSDLRSTIQSPLHPILSQLHSESHAKDDPVAPGPGAAEHSKLLDGQPEKALSMQPPANPHTSSAPTPAPRPSPPSAIAPSSRPSLPAPLPLPPLDPDLLRLTLLRDLDASRESNRRLYIDSAAQMIAMQEQIDALTRENVGLIRAMAPAHNTHAQRW